MATDLRRPLSTFKTTNVSSRRLSSADTSKSTMTTTNNTTIDPSQTRLNHIRSHILNARIHRQTIPSESTLVFNNFLYLGGLKSLKNQDRLARLNITHILSVVWIRPRKIQIPSHVKHLFIKATDSVSFDMSTYFEQACQFIEDARQSNGCVLVHCACGVSRSTTLCCAYLIKHHSMSLEQVIIRLRSRRQMIQPNPAFLRQLIHYNEQIESDKATLDALIVQLENI